ncbi:MAG: 2-methylaconitate cis-trans isomerase PrpF family protein [Alphaproteobacteria bacterium]|nr:2-methylaconitate cis-trans isomerase PrpF family protein [Alphaproteobacteria bacterium]
MTDTNRIPAVFIRGGTSKGLFFHARDLPNDRESRDAIFLAVLGSPDPYGRQLDGMGGGYSSVSKAVVIAPSDRADADVDFTFAQVVVDKPMVDYAQTCGNLSSAVGPFAVDEGLVQVADGPAVVRVFNTNTSKVYHAHFDVRAGRSVEKGDVVLPGVSGTAALVRLDYVDPGGAMTRAFLPTGNPIDTFDVPGIGSVEASLVDATNPVVFVDAASFGKTATEHPDALDADTSFMAAMDDLRRQAGVAMGLADRPQDVPLSNPKIAILAAPADSVTISGEAVSASTHDLQIRILSMEKCHKAVTGTGAMCLAAASGVVGSVPHRLRKERGSKVRIASPSGVVALAADVDHSAESGWRVRAISVERTQRRLMEGWVRLPHG